MELDQRRKYSEPGLWINDSQMNSFSAHYTDLTGETKDAGDSIEDKYAVSKASIVENDQRLRSKVQLLPASEVSIVEYSEHPLITMDK